MSIAFACLAAVALDSWFGEPNRWHPLVAFGQLAERVERALHPGVLSMAKSQFRHGVLGVVLLIMPPTVIVAMLAGVPVFGWLVSVVVLYLALGGASLFEHALPVRDALLDDNLPAARAAVGNLVSRDTTNLDAHQVSTAAVESLLENGCDAVFGALFWFAVAGAPGVVFYRLVNTLDAMWGYRTERYLWFGRAAARLDDFMNWIPARLSALGYALMGNFQLAWRCAREQSRTWESTNAGTVMAAGAGALGVTLGGGAPYHGQWKDRPVLGQGRVPGPHDLDAATALVRRTLILWLSVIVVVAAVLGLVH